MAITDINMEGNEAPDADSDSDSSVSSDDLPLTHWKRSRDAGPSTSELPPNFQKTYR